MAEENESIVPYAGIGIGEAILEVEQWSRKMHGHQRLTVLDALAVPDRVSRLIREINRALSSPDEQRDLAFGRRANEYLRNAAVKSQIASFLALEGLIDSLATLIPGQGELNRTLNDPVFQRTLDENQMITLQRSQHTQILELLDRIDKKKFDGLSSVVTALSVQADEEVKTGLVELGKMKAGSREQVGLLLSKLLTAIAKKPELSEKVATALNDAPKE
jgi:hypothetical protein